MQLRYLIPFFDTTAKDWAIEARLARWLTFIWLLVGLMVMFSASYPAGDNEFGNGWYYLQRQAIFALVGLVGFNWIIHSPLRTLLSTAHWGLLLFLGLIWVTDLPGFASIGGAARWIPIGPFLLQPSEFVKPFLVLQSARIFGQWDRLTWKKRLTWLGVFCLVLLGILIQPNLSTTALCGMVIWLIALAAGLPWVYLVSTAVGGVLLATLSIAFREYQRKRVLSFLNPWADPTGDGYQLTQSLMAIGSGGWFGTGYGQSHQKLGFLPIQYTDFIFAVFSEEFGLVGGVMLLLMLVAYATLGLYIAQKAQNIVHRLVAIGIVVLIVGQSILNIGVATGTLPTTGLPFPLWSYGGSSMLSSFISVALLIRVARENTEAEVVSFPEAAIPRPTVVPFPKPVRPNFFQSWLKKFQMRGDHTSSSPKASQKLTNQKPTNKARSRRRRSRP
ncbi:FtsW/RodA/SpoVE family cell cycle protein [Alkalinema sp. FACHB-956]|uniref:FtsW/RodA/SpoVE family cell cycle protein n=1 Tax=Alkalinema sp. FACHB-956 TaxID=2692768 RepID=UPI0016880CC8|nr:FtsW/RodA/SpoVE family cell cycle protein [Alkalinema sp. FACHB-956]MBD2329919.1 FtsW/RodA/SpoVE family cell cycle protein [Alkalinema sp. FACHB-956]